MGKACDLRVATVLLALAANSTALAQTQTPQRTTATYEDWTVRCEIKGTSKMCEMAQAMQIQGQAQPVMQIAIGQQSKGAPMKIVLQVPINVWLPAGAKLVINEKDPGIAAVYGRCLPAACLADADLKTAVSKSVVSCMLNSGQTCVAPTRMLVPRALYQPALDIAVATLGALPVGDPMAATSKLGPLSCRAQFERVQGMLDRGLAEGARMVAGGPGRPEGLSTGFYARPTVFGDVDNGMAIVRDLPGNALLLGEMGIGNTSAASLLLARLGGFEVADVTGADTGLDADAVVRKIGVLRAVLQRHSDAREPLAALAALGGFEIATLVGAVLQAAAERRTPSRRLGRAGHAGGCYSLARSAVAHPYRARRELRDGGIG